MRGHIRQRGGSWQAIVSDGFDPITKKRVQRAESFTTREAAEVGLTRMLAAKDTGSAADAGRLTFGRYAVEQWLPHQSTRVRARTLVRYRQLLTIHVLPAIGNVKLGKLRPAHIQSMLDSLDLSARTKVHVYRVTGEALRHAMKLRLLSSNPADGASPPRPERPSLTVPVAEDVGKLLEASHGWLRRALVLSASTGMRRGEVLALQWRNVDLDQHVARVDQAMENVGREIRFTLPKTDRGRRSVALPGSCVAMLRELRKDQLERRLLLGAEWQGTDLIVERGDGGPIHPDLYSTRFARLAARVGLPGVRLHDIRHFYASECLRANVHPKKVSAQLGHASVSFTLDVYSHLIDGDGEDAAAAIEAALGFPQETG